MSDFNTSEELPLGLMMQLGQNAEVMSTFANLSDAEKMQIYSKDTSLLKGIKKFYIIMNQIVSMQ